MRKLTTFQWDGHGIRCHRCRMAVAILHYSTQLCVSCWLEDRNQDRTPEPEPEVVHETPGAAFVEAEQSFAEWAGRMQEPEPDPERDRAIEWLVWDALVREEERT